MFLDVGVGDWGGGGGVGGRAVEGIRGGDSAMIYFIRTYEQLLSVCSEIS